MPIVSLHRTKITAFEQLWSVTVIIESNPSETGNFVIQSIAMVWNGNASSLGIIGNTAGRLGYVLDLLA